MAATNGQPSGQWTIRRRILPRSAPLRKFLLPLATPPSPGRLILCRIEDARLRGGILSALPDDPVLLKQIILARTGERDEANRRRDQAEIKALRLEVELLRLKKWYYGPGADRLTTAGDVAQLLLEFAVDLGSAAGESRRSSA
jgi:hypothetical protein